jgi:ankyrin repeat protein
MDEMLTFFERPKKYDATLAEELRKKYLSNTLNTSQKMELYNAAVNGNVDTLKNLIEEKKYPLMEECSASGYFWTVIHYAAHYGFDSIVNYVLETFQYNQNKLEILNLQSNLGLSPLFIAINNTTNIEKKKTILDLYVKYDSIDYKICTKENEDIFDLCKKHKLLDYLLSILKED